MSGAWMTLGIALGMAVALLSGVLLGRLTAPKEKCAECGGGSAMICPGCNIAMTTRAYANGAEDGERIGREAAADDLPLTQRLPALCDGRMRLADIAAWKGLNRSAAYSAAVRLTKAGVLRRVSRGVYARVEDGE